MTSIILLWQKGDRSDIRVANDDDNKPLLFENKGNAGKYASDNYGFGSRKATLEIYNYKVVEL
jgi:hypothetical protein